MASTRMRPIVSLLMVLNFYMYAILLGIGCWEMNQAIDYGFIIGPSFVTFTLIAGVVGIASILAGSEHYRAWESTSKPAAILSALLAWALLAWALLAWALTILAMGFAWKEIELEGRNVRLRTMEAFTIILSVTQFVYVVALYNQW